MKLKMVKSIPAFSHNACGIDYESIPKHSLKVLRKNRCGNAKKCTRNIKRSTVVYSSFFIIHAKKKKIKNANQRFPA